MRIYTCEVTTQNGLPFRYEVTHYPNNRVEVCKMAKRYHNRVYACGEQAYKAARVNVKSVRMIRIGVVPVDEF